MICKCPCSTALCMHENVCARMECWRVSALLSSVVISPADQQLGCFPPFGPLAHSFIAFSRRRSVFETTSFVWESARRNRRGGSSFWSIHIHVYATRRGGHLSVHIHLLILSGGRVSSAKPVIHNGSRRFLPICLRWTIAICSFHMHQFAAFVFIGSVIQASCTYKLLLQRHKRTPLLTYWKNHCYFIVN
jgi:hypothetical protein